MKKAIIFIFAITLIGVGIITIHSQKEFNDNLNSNEIGEKHQDEIYMEVNIMADYAVIDPKDLYNYSDIVVLANYEKDKATKISSSGQAFTTSDFKITKVLKNKKDIYLNETLSARYIGGVVSLKDVSNSNSESLKKKVNLEGLTEEELERKKIKFSLEDIGDKSLKEKKERILFLNYDEKTGEFIVVADNYGMISQKDGTIFDVKTKSYKSFSFLK